MSLFWLLTVVALYFLPGIAAYSNKKKSRGAILLLNLLLGWTVIGWVGALVWAYVKD